LVAEHPQHSTQPAPPDRGAASFVYPPTEANLRFFADHLRSGGLLAIPTETVYGLAARGLDAASVRSIFAVKGRPLMDPLILHVANPDGVGRLAHLPSRFSELVDSFWPGPLTLVLRKRPVVPDIVTAGKETVAVRMPRQADTMALLQLLDEPLAAPSANPFGYLSPTRPEHVAASFGPQVPYILDGGPCEIGLESTILDLRTPGRAVILRPGAVSPEALSSVLSLPVSFHSKPVPEGQAARAPGMLLRHYSPATPLSLFFSGQPPPRPSGTRAVVHLVRPPSKPGEEPHLFWLSETPEPETMAHALFDMLRKLDQQGYQQIACEIPPETSTGLLKAIRDRLLRAAAR
jgi:L-threonylcarbamoyladenylate synthase